MGFEWGRENLRLNPEAQLARAESRDRDLDPLSKLAASYERQAQKVMAGLDGASAHDEVARFAQKINDSTDLNQAEALERLVRALVLRKRSIFDVIPDDDRERLAFALALVRAHEKSLQ